MKTWKFILIGILFVAGCSQATPQPETRALPIAPSAQATLLPTGMPTPPPLGSADYQSWSRYVHAVYGFSLMLPPDWVIEEAAADDTLLNGHLLWLYPQAGVGASEGVQIRMTFRHSGEETLLWPTSAGEGEFVELGTLDVAHQPARRFLLVCPERQVNSIWYHGQTSANLLRANMEFGFIFEYSGSSCRDRYSLGGEVQRVGELIIASLIVPLP